MSFFSKQFIDVIDWTEPGDGILAYRYPMEDREIQNGGLRGIPPAPAGSTQHPAEFEPRPPLGVPEAHAPDQDARRPFLRSPEAVAPQGPVTDHHRQVTPCHRPTRMAAQRLAGERENRILHATECAPAATQRANGITYQALEYY